MIVYTDGILIYSLTQHIHLVKSRQTHLFVKREKCEVEMARHVPRLNQEDAVMDKAKVQAVTEWPHPHPINKIPWI